MAYGLRGALVNGTLMISSAVMTKRGVSLLYTFFLAFITFLTGPALAVDEIKILALGDSLTAGYGLEQQYAFTSQLEKSLQDKGYPVRVINGGVSGDTSAGGLSRLTWALADKPDLVIIELGANDGLRGLDPAQTRSNLKAIIKAIQKAEHKVLLTGMIAPPNLGKEYGAEFNSLYGDLAKQNDIALYPFFLDGVAANPKLNQPDGIHPTAEGAAIIVERILPYVEKLLHKE